MMKHRDLMSEDGNQQRKGTNKMNTVKQAITRMMAAVALLWLVAKLGGDSVHWLAVFFGLLAVLKSYFLVFVYRAMRRC